MKFGVSTEMTLDELIQEYTDVSGKWVPTGDVKTIIQRWLNYHQKSASDTYTNYGQH